MKEKMCDDITFVCVSGAGAGRRRHVRVDMCDNEWVNTYMLARSRNHKILPMELKKRYIMA